jgi:hypothetical protein
MTAPCRYRLRISVWIIQRIIAVLDAIMHLRDFEHRHQEYLRPLGNQPVDHVRTMLQPSVVHVGKKVLPQLVARSERPAGASAHPLEIAPALISDCDDVALGHGDAFPMVVPNDPTRFGKRPNKRGLDHTAKRFASGRTGPLIVY